MARRRKNDAAIGLLVLLGLGAWVVSKLPGEFWGLVVVGFLLLALGLTVKIVINKILDQHASKSLAKKTAATVNEHLQGLIRRQAQLVRPDAYGTPRLENWHKELRYFAEQYITPQLNMRESVAFASDSGTILGLIHLKVEQEAKRNPAFVTFSESMRPQDFEEFCAQELRESGWNARVTLQSRDQGVDVVGEKEGLRVVLQCKLYSRPVGNKAVQEAAAARAHERADYGIVVSNNRYTQDAEQLAATNNILLLHYSDLRSLDDLIRTPNKPPAQDVWYFYDSTGKVGPFTREQLRHTLPTLGNPNETLVWRPGFSEWLRAKDVSELRDGSGLTWPALRAVR